MDLQLQPGGGFQGVVTPGLHLTQLRLYCCELLDGEQGLAAALSLLPGLEHLSVKYLGFVRFSPQVLPQLQRLTYLSLKCCLVLNPSQGQPALQPLQALSRLVDLRLDIQSRVASERDGSITADMLSGSPQLTRLDLAWVGALEPGALAGMTALQHLRLSRYSVAGRTAGVAQLLSHIQHMRQLTHLDCGLSLVADEGGLPAAAVSALTASSKLQELRFNGCTLPAGAWQHVFPAGRQLPYLTSLHLQNIRRAVQGPAYPNPAFPGLVYRIPAAAPEGSRLVSCCPGLRRLLEHVHCSAAHLAELQGLLALRTLHVTHASGTGAVQAVGLLTQLEELRMCYAWGQSGQRGLFSGCMSHLTQLKQLTWLELLSDPSDSDGEGDLEEEEEEEEEAILLEAKAPGDEPVWVHLVRRHLDHGDPRLAQQAAAALAELQMK